MMRVIKEKDAKNFETNYTYDWSNRILTLKKGALYEETYSYNDGYSSITSQAVKIIKGGPDAPLIKTAVYNDPAGKVVQKSVFDGSKEISTTYKYSKYGFSVTELSEADRVAGVTATAIRGFDYDGKLMYESTYSGTSAGNSFTFTYDGIGRNVKTKDVNGNEVKYIYDSAGRLSREESSFEQGYDTIKYYNYDLNGNIIETGVSNSRPGDELTFTRTGFVYDNRNRLIGVNCYAGEAIDSFVTYGYDNVGNKISMTTGNGTQTIIYEYDRFGRLTSLTDALGMCETYEYDANGNVIVSTDRNGNKKYFSYDGLNRVLGISIIKPDDTTADEFNSYSYYSTGALKTEQNENMTTTNKYDNLGRIISQTEVSAAGTIEKTYGYDLANNRKWFKINQNGATVFVNNYSYDVIKRLSTVSDGNGLAATYEYDRNGNRTKLTYSNGTYTTYEYNKANLLTKLTNYKSNGTLPSIVLSTYSYSYRLDGNQISRADGSGEETTYKYDGLGRLTEEKLKTSPQDILTTSYKFDTAGNRSEKQVYGSGGYAKHDSLTTYSYDLNNRLVREDYAREHIDVAKQTGKILYGYDANGNQISEKQYDAATVSIDPPIWHSNFFNLGDMSELEQISITGEDVSGEVYYQLDDEIDTDSCFDLVTEKHNSYDVFNRLSAVGDMDPETEDVTILGEYSYKADGLRISKTIDGVTTRQIWDGSNISLEIEGDAILNKYTRGINLIKDDSSFFMYNAHGDVVQLLNTSGIITKSYKYDAFGNERNVNESDTNPWRYCGEYFDKETGTIYLRARYYDSGTGRFSSEDPIRDGLNCIRIVSAIRFCLLIRAV